MKTEGLTGREAKAACCRDIRIVAFSERDASTPPTLYRVNDNAQDEMELWRKGWSSADRAFREHGAPYSLIVPVDLRAESDLQPHGTIVEEIPTPTDAGLALGKITADIETDRVFQTEPIHSLPVIGECLRCGLAHEARWVVGQFLEVRCTCGAAVPLRMKPPAKEKPKLVPHEHTIFDEMAQVSASVPVDEFKKLRRTKPAPEGPHELGKKCERCGESLYVCQMRHSCKPAPELPEEETEKVVDEAAAWAINQEFENAFRLLLAEVDHRIAAGLASAKVERHFQPSTGEDSWVPCEMFRIRPGGSES